MKTLSNRTLPRWRQCTLAAALLVLAVTGDAFAAVRYLDGNSASPTPSVLCVGLLTSVQGRATEIL